MTISILPKTHKQKRDLENEENTVFLFFEQSNLKKIKSIDTYIGIMETKVKVKKKVSKRRRTKQPKYEGGSDEEFWEIMRKHGKIDHYTEFESGSRCMTDEEIALLTRIMKEEDEYFAENP
jgi:hypothetical protein